MTAAITERNVPIDMAPQGLGRLSHAHGVGALVALFLLLGRWSLDRLFPEFSGPAWLLEPRTWVLALLVAVTVDQFRSKLRHHRRPSQRGCYKERNAIILLFGYAIATILWAPDVNAACFKGYELLLIIVAVTCTAATLNSGFPQQFRTSFWLTIVLFAMVLAFSGAISADADRRLSAMGGGPNVFGRNMGWMIVGALFLQSRSSWSVSILLYGVVLLGALLAVLSGSRGAIISLAFGAAAMIILDKRHLARKVLVLAVGGVGLTAALLFTELGQRAQATLEERIVRLTIEEQYLAGRDNIYEFAWELGWDHFYFGTGLGGYGNAVQIPLHYPHNLFLEVFCETGIVGASLLAYVIFVIACSATRRRRCLDAASVAGFLMIFGAAQVSGDLYDNRGVFLLGLMAVTAGMSTREAGMPPIHGGGRRTVRLQSMRARRPSRRLKAAAVPRMGQVSECKFSRI